MASGISPIGRYRRAAIRCRVDWATKGRPALISVDRARRACRGTARRRNPGPTTRISGDQFERPGRERQWSIGRDVNDLYASRAKQLPGTRGVGWPCFGGHHALREHRRLIEHFSPARVEVERASDAAEATGQQLRESPRRSLFNGSPLQPVEAPPRHVGRIRLRHQCFEIAHHTALSIRCSAVRNPSTGRSQSESSFHTPRLPDDACGLVDSTKERTPIWKRQHLEGGTTE